MAKKKYWIGSTGPYYYDDAKDLNDPDGIITSKQSGMVADRMKVLEAPVDSDDVARYSEVGNTYTDDDVDSHLSGGSGIDYSSGTISVDSTVLRTTSGGLTTTHTIAAGDVLTIENGLITNIS